MTGLQRAAVGCWASCCYCDSRLLRCTRSVWGRGAHLALAGMAAALFEFVLELKEWHWPEVMDVGHDSVDEHSPPWIRGAIEQEQCDDCSLRENIHLVVLDGGRGRCRWMIGLIVR